MVTAQHLTTGDTAKTLGVSDERVRQLEREGKLTATRTAGGFRLFDSKQVERLRIQREQAAGQ